MTDVTRTGSHDLLGDLSTTIRSYFAWGYAGLTLWLVGCFLYTRHWNTVNILVVAAVLWMFSRVFTSILAFLERVSLPKYLGSRLSGASPQMVSILASIAGWLLRHFAVTEYRQNRRKKTKAKDVS